MQTQNRPLYCFCYNEDDGSITRTTVYEYTQQATGYVNIRYGGQGLKLRKDLLDKLHYNKIFTFNSDSERAKLIIYRSLKKKQEKAAQELRRCNAKLMIFKSRQEVNYG